MGCRPGRSTELAARLVTEQVRTAWREGGTASLLQLDLKGAFDRVDHLWLLHTLRELGLPPWLIGWVRSYLEKRTAYLRFDSYTSEAISPPAGIPQGSPLSPILFILFLAPLYKRLREEPGIGVIGFSDDTNLLAFGKNIDVCITYLKFAYRKVESWA
jgi:retron-type reverse transcriptase